MSSLVRNISCKYLTSMINRRIFSELNVHTFCTKRLIHSTSRFHAINKNEISPSCLLQRKIWLTGCMPGRILVLRSISSDANNKKNETSVVLYICAAGVFMIGMAYAGVPLYRMFCQATGLGGQAVKGHDIEKVETMEPVKERIIKVKFNADVASSMRWNFKPQQTQISIMPGETALAFYTAKNPTDVPIIGISTYNVVPFEAGQYFNKIQCFCFEEQRLNPHEQVDMPVFFFIDPEYADDPRLSRVDTITLSYTFFEAKEGMSLPLPGYMQPQAQPSSS